MKFKNLIIVVLIFTIPLALYMMSSKTEVNVTQKNEETNKPQIIKFTSLMCLDCKKLGDVIKEVYPNYSDRITLIEVQVQNNDEYTKKQVQKHNITLVPTLILINSKGKRVDKLEGFIEQSKLEQMMEKLANE